MTKRTPLSPPKSVGILLGENIARYRRAQGWTQQELAEAVEIESVTVSRIETGSSIPSLVRLVAIAEALDVSLVELVGGVSPHATDQAEAIAAALKQVKPEDRYLLLETVKRFAERLGRK